MFFEKVKQINEKYKIGEILGIIFSLALAIISALPVFLVNNLFEIGIVIFYFIIFILRLFLFIWHFKHNDEYNNSLMMYISSIVLFIASLAVILSFILEMILQVEISLMGSEIILSIIFGVIAIIKLTYSIIHLYQTKDKKDHYKLALGFIGIISSIDTLILFGEYLFMATSEYKYNIPRMVLMPIFVLGVIYACINMLIKSRLIIKKNTENKVK